MGGSGLQWSFSGKPDNPSQILSFKSSSEGGNHSIYAPGFVQKVVSSEKIATDRQPQNYGALVAKTGRLSSLSSPNGVNGAGCRVNNPESIGSAYKLPSKSAPVVSSAVVGSTNLSGESSFNGPSQMTIFYNGLVCVYDDVAPDKAQAIMLLAGNGNTRSQKPAEPKAKAQPNVVSSPPSIHPKPIHLESIHIDLSGSKSAPANPLNDAVSAGACTGKIEANPRNPAPKFPTPASNQIRHPKSALPIDPVSSGASTSSVDVSPKKPVPKFPSPALGSPASNPIRFHQSAIPIDLDSASASTPSTVEASPRNPALRYPSPATGSTKTNRFRFSPSNITIDPVLAAASISSFDSLNNPATKFTPPATGSLASSQFLERASNQFRFSHSAHASTGRLEIGLNNPATKFQPPATGFVGCNQIRFSQSAAASKSNATIEANPKNSTSNFTSPATSSAGLNQIRFSRSASPIDHDSAGAPISIVESNPIRPTAKFPDPATSSGSNQFRFPQPVERNQLKGIHQLSQNTISLATSIDPASARASSSTVEINPIKQTTKFSDPAASSGSNQLRFSHSIERNPTKPVPQNTHSAATPNSTVESNPTTTTTKFSDSKTGSGSNQICFSQSGIAMPNKERSVSNSSTPDPAKPVSPAPHGDRASAGASGSIAEAGESKEPSKISTPANGSGKPKQLRFSQSGVPLARKASLARFLEKRKERPGDVDPLGDIPPAKYRSNSE